MWSGSSSTWCCTCSNRFAGARRRRPNRRALAPAGLLVLAGLAAACAPFQFRGAAYTPPVPAPDFTLTAVDGRDFQLSAAPGGAVLLMFGYTSCPDVCPATLAVTRQAVAGLGAQGERVTVVFVTVDPLRDTPPVLAAYLENFSPAFVGLTGEPLALAGVLQDYGIEAAPNPQHLPGLLYDVDHTARLYLIDGRGRLRAQYPFGATAADLQHDLAHVLSED